jgi:hypothetical protein
VRKPRKSATEFNRLRNKTPFRATRTVEDAPDGHRLATKAIMVPMINFKVLFVLVVLSHHRRKGDSAAAVFSSGILFEFAAACGGSLATQGVGIDTTLHHPESRISHAS